MDSKKLEFNEDGQCLLFTSAGASAATDGSNSGQAVASMVPVTTKKGEPEAESEAIGPMMPVESTFSGSNQDFPIHYDEGFTKSLYHYANSDRLDQLEALLGICEGGETLPISPIDEQPGLESTQATATATAVCDILLPSDSVAITHADPVAMEKELSVSYMEGWTVIESSDRDIPSQITTTISTITEAGEKESPGLIDTTYGESVVISGKDAQESKPPKLVHKQVIEVMDESIESIHEIKDTSFRAAALDILPKDIQTTRQQQAEGRQQAMNHSSTPGELFARTSSHSAVASEVVTETISHSSAVPPSRSIVAPSTLNWESDKRHEATPSVRSRQNLFDYFTQRLSSGCSIL